MFKLITLVVLALACNVSAKPQFFYSSPVVAAPVATATSSQYIARNYNGIAAAPVVAAAAYTAPVAAAAAYTAPVAAAYTAPVAAAYTAPAAYASYYPYNTAAAYTTFF